MDSRILTREAIRLWLKSESISQKELAKTVGVAPQTISRWVTGENQPKGEPLEKIRHKIEQYAAQAERMLLDNRWHGFYPDAQTYISLPIHLRRHLESLPSKEVKSLDELLKTRHNVSSSGNYIKDALDGVPLRMVPAEFVVELSLACGITNDGIFGLSIGSARLVPLVGCSVMEGASPHVTALDQIKDWSEGQLISDVIDVEFAVELSTDCVTAADFDPSDVVLVEEVSADDLVTGQPYFFVSDKKTHCLYYAGTLDGGDQVVFSDSKQGGTATIFKSFTLLCRVHESRRRYE